jgi:hypothetical protein
MEKVKVVKAIPGILNIGDILISPEAGSDFCLEETDVTTNGTSERYVSMDYLTVSESIPEFFVFDTDEIFEDTDIQDCLECDGNSDPEFGRTSAEVLERYEFFTEQFETAIPGSEAQIVFKNLIWFIEWLYGKTELV